MQVILSEDVENLGAMGETVKVADGYARNYLIPRKLAVQLDSGSAKQIDHQKRVIKNREEKYREHLQEVSKALEALTIEIKVRAGAEDRIFGSVTGRDLADRLKELGHDIDRKTILLDGPIRELGIYSVPMRLASGIEANLKVWVDSIEEAEEHEKKKKEEETVEEQEE